MPKTIIKVVGTLITALITAVLNANDVEEVVSPFGIAVQWSLLTFLLFLGFVAWWIIGLELYKHHREGSKPKIIFKKSGEWQFYREKTPIYHGLQVWFVNEPRISADASIAEDVTASVTFYARNTKKVLNVYGCFIKAEAYDFAGTIGLMNKIDKWSPNDEPQKLQIALKWPGEETAYAFAYESFVYSKTGDGKESNREIKPSEHFVKIVFRGIRLEQSPFWFILTNPKDGVLSVSDPIKKPNLHKEGFQTE